MPGQGHKEEIAGICNESKDDARMPSPGQWKCPLASQSLSWYNIGLLTLSKEKFTMRIILIIFGISLAIFLFLGFGMRYITPPYETIAKTFFISLEKKEYKTAYEMLSTNFQKNLNFKHFQEFIENSEYKNYKQSSWFNLVVEQNKGTMQGVITVGSGKKIPLAFSFVTEKDPQASNLMPDFVTNIIGDLKIWKIDGIRQVN